MSLGTGTPALSPDGAHIAYASRGRLYVRRLDQLGAVEIKGSDGASQPFFSPDSQWIAFFTVARLMKVRSDGASPVEPIDTLGNNGLVVAGGTWGETGIIAALAPGGLYRVAPEGGAMGKLGCWASSCQEFRERPTLAIFKTGPWGPPIRQIVFGWRVH